MSTGRYILFLLFVVCTSAICHGREESDSVRILRGQWEQKLSQARNPADSVKALYNLFDITKRKGGMKYLRILYDLAERNNDVDTQIDILETIASVYASRDSLSETQAKVYSECLSRINALPDSPSKNEAEVYIKLQEYMANFIKLSGAAKQDSLPVLIERYADNKNDNIYDRVLKLYKLAMSLGYSVGGDLYSDYLDRLQLLIENLPSGNGTLKSLYYTHAATAYSLNNEYKKAYNADRQLISIYEALRRRHKARERPYYDYDSKLYASYRRMLGNYPVVSDKNIRKYNDSIQRIAGSNPIIRNDMIENPRAEAYYLYASGQYAKALPVLKTTIAHPRNKELRRKLLKMLINSAEKVGDKQTLYEATVEYNKHLESYIRQQLKSKLRDMQLFFDINDIKDTRLNQAVYERDKTISRLKTVTIILVVAVGVLLIVVIWLMAFRRNRKPKAHYPDNWMDGLM
ncbi:MAG: hypothetical protein HDS15_05220 [Bacteroides sp.]|nr:hypothetical protein [Bacteroides sp.]